MPTRSQTASTSPSWWELRNTVWPRVAGLADTRPERPFHQRVQPAGRLVQHQHRRPGRERRHQRHLLPIARRVRPRTAVRSSSNRSTSCVAVRQVRPGPRCAINSSISRPVRCGHSATSAGTYATCWCADATSATRVAGQPGAPGGRSSIPSNRRIVVDFPAPFGPRKPNTSPGRGRRSRSRSAHTAPYRLPSPSVRQRASPPGFQAVRHRDRRGCGSEELVSGKFGRATDRCHEVCLSLAPVRRRPGFPAHQSSHSPPAPRRERLTRAPSCCRRSISSPLS